MTTWISQAYKDWLSVIMYVDFLRLIFTYSLSPPACWYMSTLQVVHYNYVGWRVRKKMHKNPELGTHPFSFKVSPVSPPNLSIKSNDAATHSCEHNNASLVGKYSAQHP